MKNIFLNIHGFGSSGQNSKAQALIESFPNHKLISPDLPTDPEESLKVLEKIIAENESARIIMQGSSMGGFYALVMHLRHGIPALLINPALTPAALVQSRVGEMYDFKNGQQLLIEQEHVERFARVEKEITEALTAGGINKGGVLALIGEQDEVLDQNIMKGILTKLGAEVISYETDHHFAGYDKVTEDDQKVRSFLLTTRS
ncbi:YqiA/YcfP family alpha/beta fold hydrolase [Maridesulfovibrio frigidus]|uniref:YqiA/YcfP family alpha/beta fold hydrolase n=1 Tax=Maridesulfovibrio frigidus TaxID=340956 RepID=UPI0004E28469|nr:YqiA/YcfP family alpha/beta fold hydrolase [Maridesulfovibrio frigidus]